MKIPIDPLTRSIDPRRYQQLLIFVALLLACSDAPGTASDPTIREIESSVDHNHCTTRQFQHKTLFHKGIWFVFYSDGQHFWYQTSDDSGKSWQRANQPVDQALNGSSSFDVFQAGSLVTISHAFYPLGRYDAGAPYAKDPARRGEYRHEGRVKQGRIEGRSIRWLANVKPGFTPDYSNILQDSLGCFWIFRRESGQGVAHRSRAPHAIDQWLPEAICMPPKGRHAMDAAALSHGRLYVASMVTPDGRLYGNLYDGQIWGQEVAVLANSVTTVAGDDRRLALEFDPNLQRLHLIYIDAQNVLRYRYLDAPYHSADWSPGLSRPGLELATGVFTCALSIDSSSTPYDLVITYGIEKHVGRDKRERTGVLFARRFAGNNWQGKPQRVSQAGSIHNWYPSVNQDVCNGLCVMYSRSENKSNLSKPLAVMVSVSLFNNN